MGSDYAIYTCVLLINQYSEAQTYNNCVDNFGFTFILI